MKPKSLILLCTIFVAALAIMAFAFVQSSDFGAQGRPPQTQKSLQAKLALSQSKPKPASVASPRFARAGNPKSSNVPPPILASPNTTTPKPQPPTLASTGAATPAAVVISAVIGGYCWQLHRLARRYNV